MIRLGHASADMVTEEVRKSGTNVTVASVYNILSQLADIRIYNRRLSSNSKMYFDVNSFRHIHLYDRENNRYRDVFDDELTVEDIDIQLVARPTRKMKANA